MKLIEAGFECDIKDLFLIGVEALGSTRGTSFFNRGGCAGDLRFLRIGVSEDFRELLNGALLSKISLLGVWIGLFLLTMSFNGIFDV